MFDLTGRSIGDVNPWDDDACRDCQGTTVYQRPVLRMVDGRPVQSTVDEPCARCGTSGIDPDYVPAG